MLCEKKICYDDLDLTMNPIPFLLESTLGFDVSKIYGGFAVKPSLRLHCILSEKLRRFQKIYRNTKISERLLYNKQQ